VRQARLDEEQRDEFRDRYERAKELGNDEHDVLKAAVRQARKASTCPFCGEPQADIKHEKPTTYYEVQDVLSGDYSERIAAAMQPDEEEDDPGTSPQELAEKTDIDLERINEIMAGEFRPRRRTAAPLRRRSTSTSPKRT